MSIDELFPDSEEARYVAVLECSRCGATGHCYSDTKIIGEYQFWDCDECGGEAVKHDVLMQTTGGEVPRR